jgi:single-stranded DNA-binding protein
MTNDFIRTNVRGRLTETPEVRMGKSGKYCFLKVAVNKPERNGNDGKHYTFPPAYISVAISGGHAEYAEKYLHKGDEIELLNLECENQKSERELNGKTYVYNNILFRLPYYERIRLCGHTGTGNTTNSADGIGDGLPDNPEDSEYGQFTEIDPPDDAVLDDLPF